MKNNLHSSGGRERYLHISTRISPSILKKWEVLAEDHTRLVISQQSFVPGLSSLPSERLLFRQPQLMASRIEY